MASFVSLASEASRAMDIDLRRNVAWLIAIRAVIGTILLGSAIVAADHRARIVSRRSVLLPDRPHLRADDHLRADAAVRRPAPVAGRPAARRRRADRVGVHLFHRRHHQLLLVAVRAADRSPPARSSSAAAACWWRRSARSCTSASCSRSTCRRPGSWSDPWLNASTLALPPPSVAQYTVALNVFGFFAVALLSGSLAEQPAVGRRPARAGVDRDRRPAGAQPARHRQPAERPGDHRSRTSAS